MKEEYSQSALLCVEGEPVDSRSFSIQCKQSIALGKSLNVVSPGDMCVNRQFNVSLPLDYIPDSESATVSVTGTASTRLVYTYAFASYYSFPV